MEHGEPSRGETIDRTKRAIIDQLRREYPYPLTVTPLTLAERAADSAFVEAAASLQEDGLIMYEALLIGAGPVPQLLEAALTRRGQMTQSEAP